MRNLKNVKKEEEEGGRGGEGEEKTKKSFEIGRRFRSHREVNGRIEKTSPSHPSCRVRTAACGPLCFHPIPLRQDGIKKPFQGQMPGLMTGERFCEEPLAPPCCRKNSAICGGSKSLNEEFKSQQENRPKG